MKIWIGCLLFGLLLTSAPLISQGLSESAQISVITCGNGTDIYSLFGHSAVRVYDPQQDFDVAFNYGTFDFSKPNFTLNFLRGKLLYQLSVSTYERFLQSYHYEQRSVKEQVLQLTFTEKQVIFDLLRENALPQNREYLYDFFFDNCTTRIRDLLSDALPSLQYPAKKIKAITFREMLHENLNAYPWTRFGMDLILGQTTDRFTDVQEQMFLPAYFFDYLDQSRHADGPVVAETHRVLEYPDVSSDGPFITPVVFFSFLFLIELVALFLIYITGDERFFRLYDKLWFGLMFLVFLIFTIMWLFTDHAVCSKNWNLLWTFPWMILPIWGLSGEKSTFFINTLTIFIALLLLLCWSVLPQQLPQGVIFIILISLLKALRHIGFFKYIDHWRYNKSTSVAVVLFSLFSLGGLRGQDKIGGITLVAPPREFASDPMIELVKVNSTWVALVPYAFMRNDSPKVIFGSDRQWWGERLEGIETCINLAHKNGLKVMLKPQVWIRGAWVGHLEFEKEEDWIIWENSYRDYIMSFIDLAVRYDIDMFCVGTEFESSVNKREKFWRRLIAEVRQSYKGKLVYSSNWDTYEKVPFWDALDYVGISAYFPLTDMNNPMKLYLSYKWRSITNKLRKFSKRQGRKVLFTEFGYLSVDGAAGKTWELEKNIDHLDKNEDAQATALEALFDAFWNEDFWAGGFLWKWFPDGHGHEGYPEKDYTPQGKLAESIITKWYGKSF